MEHTEARLSPGVQEAIAAIVNPEILPDFRWTQGDDKCNCAFQRIGHWTNPYLAETLEYRWCCMWQDLVTLLPQLANHHRVTNGYWNENTGKWDLHPREWDSTDAAMPIALWYRQLAKQTGRPLDEIRESYKDRLSERPKPLAKPRLAEPTKAERIRALEARMRASGWLIEGEHARSNHTG